MRSRRWLVLPGEPICWSAGDTTVFRRASLSPLLPNVGAVRVAVSKCVVIRPPCPARGAPIRPSTSLISGCKYPMRGLSLAPRTSAISLTSTRLRIPVSTRTATQLSISMYCCDGPDGVTTLHGELYSIWFSNAHLRSYLFFSMVFFHIP